MSDDPKPDVAEKVLAWLYTEGYPLEFWTAAQFRSGLEVQQSAYVRCGDEDRPREIDVLATYTAENPIQPVRASAAFVVECKWSKNKPWIVFCNDRGIRVTDCMAQAIANARGRHLLHELLEAGSRTLFSDLFEVPIPSGFGGRQAFSDNRDQVYEALQSVVSKATAYVNQFDRRTTRRHEAVIAFPIVVVDGDLFVTTWDKSSGDLVVTPADRARLHWHGAASWDAQATVDIVTAAHLPEFVGSRANAACELANEIWQHQIAAYRRGKKSARE